MKKAKNIGLLIMAFTISTFSCKKMMTEDLLDHVEVKKYDFIPVKLEAKTQIIELKYLVNTGLLTEIKNVSNGKREVLIYNSDKLLSEFEIYDNNKLVYSSSYFRDAEKRVNMIHHFKVNGSVYIPAGYLTLAYNLQNQITKIKSFTTGNILLSNQILEYDKNSNLIIATKDLPLPAEKSSFTYDAKNGLFKYVADVQLISMASQYKFFSVTVNNLLMSSGDKVYSFNYVYNSDNYPDQVTLNELNTKTTFKITYKKLPD